MRKVIFEQPPPNTIYPVDAISLNDVLEDEPIFVMKNDNFIGMVVLENDGWIIRFGGRWKALGSYESRRECLKSSSGLGYEYFIES